MKNNNYTKTSLLTWGDSMYGWQDGLRRNEFTIQFLRKDTGQLQKIYLPESLQFKIGCISVDDGDYGNNTNEKEKKKEKEKNVTRDNTLTHWFVFAELEKQVDKILYYKVPMISEYYNVLRITIRGTEELRRRQLESDAIQFEFIK